MKSLVCAACGAELPMSSMVLIGEGVFCPDCRRAEIGVPTRILDPTICKGCKKDNGETPLGTVSGIPTCDDCAAKLRSYGFPGWLKIAMSALVVLAIASFCVNWRFFEGYIKARAAYRAAGTGDIETAADSMEAAAKHVPESTDLKSGAKLYRGLYLLASHRASAALPYLYEYKKLAGGQSEKEALILILDAEASAAFEVKDYDLFLQKATERMKATPQVPQALAQMASACACKYAITGDEKYREESNRWLEQARELAGEGDPEMEQYVQRIRKRLETREILSREDYEEKYGKAQERR
jgi:hypothetical protein